MNAIGQPVSRADGRLKVTGGARYTADIPVQGAAHAAIFHSTIANGRTVLIDTAAAEAAPGVLAVLTRRNMPRMNRAPQPWNHLRPYGQSYLPIQDEQIHYAGQPVALVVAETLDQAAYGGPPAGDHPDHHAGCGQQRQAHRHPPPQHHANVYVRQLYRIRDAGLPSSAGCQRGHLRPATRSSTRTGTRRP